MQSLILKFAVKGARGLTIAPYLNVIRNHTVKGDKGLTRASYLRLRL